MMKRLRRVGKVVQENWWIGVSIISFGLLTAFVASIIVKLWLGIGMKANSGRGHPMFSATHITKVNNYRGL